MTALAQLAAFDTLDAQTIDRLLAQHLVDTFAAHAIPEQPVDLDLLVVDAGAALVWRDPGAASFHAAAEFHWSVWAVTTAGERVVAAGVSHMPRARAEFAVEDADYQVRVYATNQCPRGESLESSIAVASATR
jgi:hypothetical protein